MIQYKCRRCHAKLESSDSMAGQPDKCPLCGETYVVPLTKEQKLAEKHRRRQRRTEAWRRTRKRVLSAIPTVGVIGLIVAAGCTAFFVVHRSLETIMQFFSLHYFISSVIGLAASFWTAGAVAAYFRTRKAAALEERKRAWGTIDQEKEGIAAAKEALERETENTKRRLEHTRIAEKRRNERAMEAVVAAKEALEREAEEARETVSILAQQKSQGFPWLAKAYGDYFYLEQLKQAKALEEKKHPALRAAESVREIARARRTVERKLRIANGFIEYWLSLFPFLEGVLGDPGDELLRAVRAQDITEPIREVAEMEADPVRFWLSKEEYARLSTTERNQRALDRWRKRRKTKWQIGRQYERYIGYIHEQKGYRVYYQGILEGYADLGRDLIARREDETLVIQCKHWSRHKRIHEKHVNQLFGTVTKYAMVHPEEHTLAVLYVTNELSDLAREFADYLHVTVHEGFPLGEYPVIKCNVSRATGEKIYHLPFDQMYDRTIIEPERGERYASTVAEAEQWGFRRAWRWRGTEEV